MSQKAAKMNPLPIRCCRLNNQAKLLYLFQVIEELRLHLDFQAAVIPPPAKHKQR